MKNFVKKHLALIGIIIILISSFLDVVVAPNYIHDEDANNDYIYNIMTIATKMASAIGVSLVVGYFTTKFQKEDFVKEEYVKDVQEIYNAQISPLIEDSLSMFITNPNTMRMLNKESKEKLIVNALKINDGLNAYKEEAVHQIMDFTEYRRNGNIVADAYIKDGIVYVDATISYTKCTTEEKLSDEPTFVDDKKTTELIYIKFINPNDSSKYKILSQEDEKELLELNPSPAFGSSFEYVNYSGIPNEFKNMTKVNVEKQIRFKGLKHWINFGWLFNLPTQGFNFSITCRNGLIIKENIIIDSSNTYNIPSNGKNDKFNLSTTQWVSANTGFVITIGKDEEEFNNPKDV